jgi:hypothetical protein
MNARVHPVLIAALLLAAGCVARSVHPAYTVSDIVSEPRLLGEWEGLPVPAGGAPQNDATWEPEGAWTVQRGSRGVLRIAQQKGEERNAYHGHLLRLGGQLFLDLAPDLSDQWKARYSTHVVLCHSLSTVHFSGDTLIVGMLRGGWAKDLAEHGQLDRSVGFALDEDDEAILTGETAAIRQLLVRAAQNPGAFTVGRFMRLK